MTIRDNINRGVLFKNSEKENPKYSDYKGNANINGEEFWLDAWINESKNGVKYLSLRFKPKKTAGPPEKPPFNDEIPL